MIGILLNTNYDLLIRKKVDSRGLIVSGMAIGDTTDQEAAIVLQIEQGELKEDPLLGCGLTTFIRGKLSNVQIDQRIRSHFTRAGIDYDTYKDKIDINTETA